MADLVKTPAGGLEIRARLAAVPVTRRLPARRLAAALDTFARRSDSLARRPQAQLKRPLARDGAQHALGGVIAEARRNLARADLGLVRNASIRADLPAGPVTLAALRRWSPPVSDLVRLTLTGAQLQALLERALETPRGPGLASCRRARPLRSARSRGPASQGGDPGRRQEAPARARAIPSPPTTSTAAGAGGLPHAAGVPAERVGLLDVEAVATYLRRLPQPVEAEASSAFQSTRR